MSRDNLTRRNELLACQARLERLSSLSAMLRDALVESHSKTGRFNEPVCAAMVRAIADAIQQVRTDARLDD